MTRRSGRGIDGMLYILNSLMLSIHMLASTLLDQHHTSLISRQLLTASLSRTDVCALPSLQYLNLRNKPFSPLRVFETSPSKVPQSPRSHHSSGCQSYCLPFWILKTTLQRRTQVKTGHLAHTQTNAQNEIPGPPNLVSSTR